VSIPLNQQLQALHQQLRKHLRRRGNAAKLVTLLAIPPDCSTPMPHPPNHHRQLRWNTGGADADHPRYNAMRQLIDALGAGI
jgi:hypothetical protein